MNDQRQVIFSQRLKILKQEEISTIIDDFFKEILEDLREVFEKFKKSNDEKYFTEIKNITGNSLSDVHLQKLALGSEDQFIEEIKNLFLEKQKTRIDILGTEQNKSLEKKIFLQIIDFSWRSHLQYLEQLRQVIGL